MSVKKPLAIVATAAMVMTGAAFGSSVASADAGTGPVYVPSSSIGSSASDYNAWHFGQNPAQEYTTSAAGESNGMLLASGKKYQVIKGNGNDLNVDTDATSVADLAGSLEIVTSKNSDAGLYYQIEVRIKDADGAWTGPVSGNWSTLRAPVANAAGATWESSKSICGVDANTLVALSEVTTACGDDLFPIAAGFLGYDLGQDTLVSSFTAGDETTKFYAEPAAPVAGAASSDYVDEAGIRADESTYPGWHQGYPLTDADLGTFKTVAGEKGATLGLEVTGKAQILNGFADAGFQQGALAFANDMKVAATGGAVFAQIPVFFYADGVSGKTFATLRAEVPASGTFDATTQWTSSKAIPGFTGLQGTIEELTAAMGQHEVIGYGFLVNAGVTATVTEVTFNGATTTFAKAADPVDPVDPVDTVKFSDVKPGQKFSKEISWMAAEGITTGIKQADGTFKYEPKWSVTREAMSAFLYRLYATDAQKAAPAPAVSPFADVKTTDKFYKEIAWMGTEGHSTGIKQASGKANFEPKWNITREAMAAFSYRIDNGKKADTPKVSPFADVKPGDKFYKEIAWMSTSKLSTGIKQGDKVIYAPKWNTTREAMAAFLFRANN